MDKKKRQKKIKSLEKQKMKHLKKIMVYERKNYALIDYWKREIGDFEKEIDKEKKKLEED
mgnify:CR=1 FL=1